MDEKDNKGPRPGDEGSGVAPSFLGGLFFEVWEFGKIVIISLAIVLPIRFFVAQPFVVRGASMEPNFHNGEYLIIDESSYYFREPKRGEVIVFRYPEDPSEFFIKRIIGLPGEHVEIVGGKVKIINAEHPQGLMLEESYLPKDTETFADMTVDLSPSEYFVMGDNRLFSSDSRKWGPLDKSYFIGRAWVRLWPLGGAGPIDEASYK